MKLLRLALRHDEELGVAAQNAQCQHAGDALRHLGQLLSRLDRLLVDRGDDVASAKSQPPGGASGQDFGNQRARDLPSRGMLDGNIGEASTAELGDGTDVDGRSAWLGDGELDRLALAYAPDG
jgi:hypothetical protein